MLVIAGAAWVGGLLGTGVPHLRNPVGVLAAAALVLGAGVLAVRSQHRSVGSRSLTALGALGIFAAVAISGAARAAHLADDPVADLAAQQAAVTVRLVVTSDPRLVDGRFEDYVTFRGRVDWVGGRGRQQGVRAPVHVRAGEAWHTVRLGGTLVVSGRLGPATEPSSAGVLSVRGPPPPRSQQVEPDLWWRAAERVRASLRDSVAERPDDQRALVPALVVGDDAGMDPELEDDVRTTGLTHLTAVSGTNLTLLVGFLLMLARWLGIRGRGRVLVALVGIAGFLVLARAEPSVVRAAAMGVVALIGLGSGGARRGIRALGVAVVCLLVTDPWLATSIGFALSAVATAGILLLAPGWRAAIVGWLPQWVPRWTAEAVAVPLAAQLACTPLVAAISGQVSLVAVAANLLVAPAVGPATVLGLAAALVGLVWGQAGVVLGTVASWCVGWIVVVATWGARLPGAAVDWGLSPGSLVLLTAACVALAVVMPRVLGHPVGGLVLTVVLVASVLVGPVRPGWPPPGWVVAACDVGQGDALAVRVGEGQAVVVDAGPDPVVVADCLRGLDIDEVPLVVLTHFHADHVDGLAGVLEGHQVGAALVSPLADPPAGASDVDRTLTAAGIPARVPALGETFDVGAARFQVVWPPARPATDGDGSPANNASLVLLVKVAGVTVLLTGDVEPPAQRGLARVLSGARVDVLKLPHHGSADQEIDFLTGLRPRAVLVSVGADNDYGHPAPEALAPFQQAGAPVLRTDQDGDIAVVVEDGRLATVMSR
jgi:competence protein ComEC